MIKPTVGRVVLYRPMDHEPSVRHAATVAYVNNDDTVNLSVVNCFGVQYSVQGVTLIADPEKVPAEGQAEWMAYQYAGAGIKPDPSAFSFLSGPTELGVTAAALSSDQSSDANQLHGSVPLSPQGKWPDNEPLVIGQQVSIEPAASSGVPGDMDDDEVITGDDLVIEPEHTGIGTGTVEGDADFVGPLKDSSEPKAEPISILSKVRKK